MPACFFSTKVFMAFLQVNATHFAGLFVTPDTLTLTHSLYFLLVLIATSTRSSLAPFQNGIKLSQDVRFKPYSMASFHSALLKVPGPVENNF